MLATFHDPNPGAGGCFGYSVAGVGNKVVVGAPYLGSVYLFDSQTGFLLGSLANPNPGSGNNFGHSVAVVGGKVVVGTSWDTHAGAAYLFDVGSGDPLLSLYNPAPAEGGLFGGAVAGLGKDIIVGYGTTGRNTVYLFEGVPEPATLSLLALGGALALLRRRSASS
jgi:hypothetical protein